LRFLTVLIRLGSMGVVATRRLGLVCPARCGDGGGTPKTISPDYRNEGGPRAQR
jgi:hypothetical protein